MEDPKSAPKAVVLSILCRLVWGADGKEKRLVKRSSERCFGSQNSQKIEKKSILEASWALLGAKRAHRGSQRPPCVRGPQYKLALGAVWGGLGPLLESSWALWGGLGGFYWAIFLALGHSWRGFGSASVAKALPRAFFDILLVIFG